MQQASPLLPHPQRSASWSCHPRCCRSPALTLFMSRRWRSGPVGQLCLQHRWAQPPRTTAKSLCRTVTTQILHHLQAHLKRPHHRPHLQLCYRLTLQLTFQAQPQTSCLHPLGRTAVRCRPSPNQSCEYLLCGPVSPGRRVADGPGELRSREGVNGESQALYAGVTVAWCVSGL